MRRSTPSALARTAASWVPTVVVSATRLARTTTFTDTQFSDAHHCDFWEPILVP
jgi:hypothetical protein